MARSTARRRVVRVRIDADGEGVHVVSRREDVLAAEEPLEIRIDGSSWAVTMRTPGDDFDLVAGFLVGEGVLTAPDQLRSLRYCAGRNAEGEQTYNVIDAHLGAGAVPPSDAAARHSTTTSACGICGTESIEAVAKTARLPLGAAEPLVDAAVVAQLPDTLRDSQQVFDATGGVHAAGLFAPDGTAVRQGARVGAPRRETPPGTARAAGVGAGVVRARSEGAACGHPDAGGGRGAVDARGATGARHGADPRRIQSQRLIRDPRAPRTRRRNLTRPRADAQSRGTRPAVVHARGER